MASLTVKLPAALLACLCLTGCITQRDHVLAPDARGVVIHAGTDRPVAGAQVRYADLERASPVMTDAGGRFTLSGRTERRTIVAFPVSGVYRDLAQVRVSAPDLADGYASAAFINGLGAAPAIYPVTVLLFPADADETPLHALMRDCIDRPEQHHALHLAAYVATINPASPPDWMDEDAVEALGEHLEHVLPRSGFGACERGEEAFATFSAQTAALEALHQPRSLEMTRSQ